MVNVQNVSNSNVSFGRKPIDLGAVQKLQANLAKEGRKLSNADEVYLLKRLLEQQTNKELPFANLMQFLAKNDGEIQNQLLNGIFTSTLAPAMIFLNPFVKKTDEQKLKTALRQPVSAINSLTFSLAATMAISKTMSAAANKGYIASQDLRMKPSEDMLKKMFYKELNSAKKLDKTATKEAIAKLKAKGNAEAVKAFKPITKAQDAFLANCQPEAIEMIKTINKKSTGVAEKLRNLVKKPDEYLQTYFEKYSSNVKNGRKEIFQTLMEAKPEDVNFKALDKGTLKIGSKNFNVKDIPNMTQKSLQKFINKYNINKVGIDVNDSKAVKNYIEETFKLIDKNFNNFKKVVNPVLGIPVAIAACYILNAIYPPLRDKWAPPLMKLFNVTPDSKPVTVASTSVEGGNK